MGFIDIPNVSEDNMCDIQYNLKNMLIKPQSTDEHSIGIELEFDVDGSAYTSGESAVTFFRSNHSMLLNGLFNETVNVHR